MEKVLEKSELSFIPLELVENLLKEENLSEISAEEVIEVYFKYYEVFSDENWKKFKNSTLLRHNLEQKKFWGEDLIHPAFDIEPEFRNPRYNEFSKNLQSLLASRFIENNMDVASLENDEKKIILARVDSMYGENPSIEDLKSIGVENKDKEEKIIKTFSSNFPIDKLIDLEENLKVDKRISQQIMETVWYFRYLGISDENVEKLTRLILEIEPLIRNKKRKFQKSKVDPKRKELVFNHFLDVTRISGGRIEQGRTYWNFLNNNQKKNIDYFHDEKNLVGTFIIALLHDYAEDKFLNCDEIQEILKKLKFDDKITKRVAEVLPHLNVNNYKTEETSTGDVINHENYLDMLFEFPEAVLVKISDKLSNYSSGIPKKHFKKGKKDELSVKVQLYEKFEEKCLEIWGIITTPERFLKDLEAKNKGIYTKSKSFKKLKKLALAFQKRVSSQLDLERI